MSKRKDGSFRYDGHWRVVRQQVLERDDHRCQLRYPGCQGEATEVDHVADVAMGGALYDPDNCRAVCAPVTADARARCGSGLVSRHRAGRGRSRKCRAVGPEGRAIVVAGS